MAKAEKKTHSHQFFIIYSQAIVIFSLFDFVWVIHGWYHPVNDGNKSDTCKKAMVV